MESIGVNCEEVSRSGEALAVSELTIKFISPLRVILTRFPLNICHILFCQCFIEIFLTEWLQVCGEKRG